MSTVSSEFCLSISIEASRDVVASSGHIGNGVINSGGKVVSGSSIVISEVLFNSIKSITKVIVSLISICPHLVSTCLKFSCESSLSILKFLDEVFLQVRLWHLIDPSKSISDPCINLVKVCVTNELSLSNSSISKCSECCLSAVVCSCKFILFR